MSLKKDIHDSQLVTLDYQCSECGNREERMVRQRERGHQICGCGDNMVAQFPLGHQLDAECQFKPFLDDSSPYITTGPGEVMNSRSQWREREKRMKKEFGLRDERNTQGWGVSDEAFAWAEKKAKEL